MNYVSEIRASVRKRHTRKELACLYHTGTGRSVPLEVNLRAFVAEWHSQQQAINAGAKPSAFWRRANGLF